MFIRRVAHKNRKNHKDYYTYKLVESIRTERGPRQRDIVNLGVSFDLPKEKLERFCAEGIFIHMLRSKIGKSRQGGTARFFIIWVYVSITAISLPANGIIATGLAPNLTDISAAPLRFSPATNLSGIRDTEGDKVTMTFTLNKQAAVTATVYSATGSLIRTITETDLPAGQNQLSWNGRNNGGILMADGNYAIQLRAQGDLCRTPLL